MLADLFQTELNDPKVRAFQQRVPLPRDITEKLLVTEFVRGDAGMTLTRRTLHGIGFVVHVMRHLLENDELPSVKSVQDFADSLDDRDRWKCCIDDLENIGWTIEDVIHGVVNRAMCRQWDDIQHMLGVEW